MYLKKLFKYKDIRLHFKKHYSNENNEKWESVIGLEVHAQISSLTKLFSRSSTVFGSSVNTNVSLFDCSIPGTLPVLNKRCVEAAVKTALTLNCNINAVSMFDRKHYFYGDLPTGYQITQQRQPIAHSGYLEFEVYSPGVHKTPYLKQSKIKQLQLEQDSGKSLHDDNQSLVDLNRAGVPLMEIVFEPDLWDGEEAAALVKELVNILERIETCSCKMEEGAIRVDANVSVNKKGATLGTRTEIKNIGSIRGVAGAIRYEIERQIDVIKSNKKVINETRSWDALNKITLPMRDKEQLQDYRYMPEPNLPPLHVSIGPVTHGCVSVEEIRSQIPELPKETRKKLIEKYGLSNIQAIILVNERVLLSLFEAATKEETHSKSVANILLNDFLTLVNKEKLSLEEINITGSVFYEIVQMLKNGTINRNTTKMILQEIIMGNSDSPSEIVAKKDWAQINEEIQIRKYCEKILDENPSLVSQYKSGKKKVFKAFLGKIANSTNNRANMTITENVLKELLND